VSQSAPLQDVKRLVRNGQFWLDVLVSAVLPWLVYQWAATRFGEARALWYSALPPACMAVLELIIQRRVDVISGLSLAGIGVSLVIDGVGGDARMILVRESLVTGGLGGIGLSSLLWPRPAMFHLARAGITRGNPGRELEFEANWGVPAFRRAMWVLTGVWSGGLVAEAVVRLVLVWRMPPGEFLAVSPFLQYGTMALLFGWTVWYQRMRRPGDL